MKLKSFLATFLAMSAVGGVEANSFRPVQPGEVQPGMTYEVQQPPVEDPHLFQGKRVAVLAAPGVQDIELTFPYEYLVSRGAQVEIFSPSWVQKEVLLVDYVKPTAWASIDGTLEEALNQDFDLILVPGGAWSTQVLRKDGQAMAILQKQRQQGRALAIICSGAQLLIDSGLARGHRVTGTPSVSRDLENAGGIYVDQPKVLEGNLLMSRSPGDLEYFVEGIKQLLIQ